VCTKDGAVSLLVDEIGDVIEVNRDTREKPPATLRGPTRALVRGVYKLADRLRLELSIVQAIALNEAPEEASHASV
jgi:purine-binding chemotaxis protein CheW